MLRAFLNLGLPPPPSAPAPLLQQDTAADVYSLPMRRRSRRSLAAQAAVAHLVGAHAGTPELEGGGLGGALEAAGSRLLQQEQEPAVPPGSDGAASTLQLPTWRTDPFLAGLHW